MSTPDGLYEVRLGSFADKSKYLPDFIHVKRAFDKNASLTTDPVQNREISNPQLIDTSNEATLKSPEFKEIILRAGCQLAKSYNDQPINYTGPALIDTAEQMADAYKQGAHNFYLANCLK